MNIDTMPRPKVHYGKNIKRLREILDIKQETLAFELNMSQQTVSRLEAKDIIDDETLNKVAEVLKVPVEAIKNFTEEATINIIANTFNEGSIASVDTNHGYIHCTFNPIDKIVELYERMLEMEKAKR